MSNLKRLVSSILVLAMIATSGVFTLGAFAEDEAASTPKTIVLTEEDIAVAEKLETFGIIDAVDEGQLKTAVTRADTVHILMNYLGMGKTDLGSTTSPFYDVSVEDENIDAYNVLYNAGYISGDENKNFNPQNNLTYNEAVTLVINVMGYKVFAVRNGGYPEGYLYTANKNDLLGGLRGDGNAPIPYCDFYLLLERSLKADAVAERIYTGDGEANFEMREGYTVLEELFGIKELKGIVTGSENTRLMSFDSSSIGADQIEIEGTVYDTPGKSYADFLGMYVAAYGKKNEQGEYEVVYIEAVKKRNNEYQISAEDLLKDKTTSDKIYYTNEEYKEKHLKVNATTISVIYNGKMYSGYGSIKNALPANGFIRALDNTGDEVIDVLFVNEFDNYVVGSLDFYSCKLYDKFDATKNITIDPDVDDIRIYNDKNQNITMRDIQLGEVVSIMKSKNATGRKLITVYQNKGVVNGTVDELLDNGAYLIGGKTYKLAQNMVDYIADGDIPPVNLGMNAEFYLDIEGKISYYVMGKTTSNKFAFVAGVDKEVGINNIIRVKLFDQSGEWLELECVNPINIDGYKYKLDTEAQVNTAVSKIPLGEVVLYNMASEKLNYIDTKALNKGNLSKAADVGNLNVIASGSGFFQRGGMCFNSSDMSQDKFVASSGVVVFITPDRANLLTDLTKYSVASSLAKNSYTSGGSGRDFEQVLTDGYAAYNIGEADINVAKCVLLRGASVSKTVNSNASMGIISKITTATDKEGVKRTKLYYTVGGDESSYMLANEVGYSYTMPGTGSSVITPFADMGLEVGDIINIVLDENEMIAVINVVYRQNRNSAYVTAGEEWISPGDVDMDIHSRTLGGNMGTIVAYDAENEYLQFTAGVDENGDPITYNISTIGAMMSVYRNSIKRETRARATDFIPGDTVLIVTTEFNKLAQQIIILK